MQVFKYPEPENWTDILRRPVMDNLRLLDTVQEILKTVREKGDTALLDFTRRFDGVELDSLEVNQWEIDTAGVVLPVNLKAAIQVAANNIRKFHLAQVQRPEVIETMPGIRCWRKSVGIEKVGLYIPGGTAPLFSTILMLGIPASIAGCNEIVLCSPPDKTGKLHPAILYTASLVGITKIYKIGGVQAIAAMAFGTTTVPRVFKIFGPGNQYVTAAKQLVQQQGIAIDMPAGPSEVAIFADSSANADFVAADLLSQAEHGVDSQVLLVTTDESLIGKVKAAIMQQIEHLGRKNFAAKALDNSKAVLVPDENIGIQLLNQYAPEHLILATDRATALAEKVINAGSVFIGHFSPESVGDYASGTNHTLPTNGYATAYSGVSLDSFVKKITFQQLEEHGLQQIAATVITMAEAEGLDAHARAVSLRTESARFTGEIKPD
ncbi:histidinol dehydrogenase [Flavihumibacter fluvii]|uniref:histidinol dehydrogenase n=1 Tax=Flavihumibacter fluvii TaxID=2838157 RepID=UPI001BDE326C|nr:histidinol dehydrogenase [Flavihumibacter fluvii]ULQ53585.1 histidinol dehydrogenase [Flavihumibacter fluvii]